MLKKLILLLIVAAPVFAQNVFPPNGGSSGGTCSTLGGDLNGTCTAATVVAINGLAVPLSANVVGTNSSRQIIANTGTISNNTSGTAASLAGGAIGQVPYQSAADTTVFLAGNTAATDQVLTSTGTGSAAQAPTLKNAPALSAANMTNFPIVTRNIGATFGSFQSGATALSSSLTACVPSYYAGTITSVELIGDVSGSVTVDVKTVAHTSWTGTASVTSITASDIPALSSAARYTDSTLTGWTTSVTAGTDFCFVLTSPTTVAGVAINLKLAVTN